MRKAIAGVASVLLAGAALAAAPDKVLINGKIITVDDQFSIAEALAISGTRIQAVGSNAAIRARAGQDTEIVDLGGRAVIPGLIDSHLHVIRASEHWSTQARFDAVLSRAAALERVREVVARARPGEWIYSLGGWIEEQFRDDPRGFTRAELDAIAPRNPVFLQAEYERAYVNSAYLKAVGFPVRADQAYIAAARGLAADVVRDDQGVATGVLDGGFWMVSRAIEKFPVVSPQVQNEGIRALTRDLNRLGLTSVFDPGGMGIQPQSYERFRDMASRGELTVRVFHTLSPELTGSGEKQVAAVISALEKQRPFQGDDYFDLLALGEVYYRDFHFDSMTHTVQPGPAEIDAARRILTAAAQHGWQVQTHATHPTTMKNLFDLMEEINAVHPLRQLRWSITHADSIDATSLERARALGMNIQLRSTPVIGGMDEAAEMYGERLLDMPPLRLVQDSGVTFGLTTDGTKASQINPFVTLWWAVSGKKLDGRTITRQTLTRQEALIAHTRSNALMMFQESRSGALKPGLLADLVVLDRDYLTVPVDEIAAIKPVATMVGGAFVFNAGLAAKSSAQPGLTPRVSAGRPAVVGR
jgi:predicted amidohydrolase YtcJ